MFFHFFSRINNTNYLTQLSKFKKLSNAFVSYVIFVLSIMFIMLNLLLDNYQNSFFLPSFSRDESSLCFTPLTLPRLVCALSLSAGLIDVYLYPFIYVFILITVLSIIFCLTYNKDELYSFMFYCSIILVSGYFLFFTDSIITFFFAYEMLLVPSFFILYKFAKTRRCIEAAYLMFFWTQFGALFLVFGFLYLFFIVGTSSFNSVSLHYFSGFEVNFLFLCFFVGFGVKLPVWPFYG